MQLTISSFGKYSAHHFSDTVTQTSFTIIPDRGALLSDFRYKNKTIIDGCLTPESVDFNNWGKSWLMFPFPNRLKDGHYEWQGKSYQFPINDEQNHNALHGFIWECPFEVTHTEATDNKAAISLNYTYNGERSYFPFPFIFNITYQLTSQGQFLVDVKVKNSGDTTFPMGLGWHPYFQLTTTINTSKLETLPLEMIGVDQRMIPTGKRYEYDRFTSNQMIGLEVLDNCFAFAKTTSGNISTYLRGEDIQLEIWQDVATFPYLQLFTPEHRQSIAIEPMTCNIDAFNNGEGLIQLAPNETWKGAFGFHCTL